MSNVKLLTRKLGNNASKTVAELGGLERVLPTTPDLGDVLINWGSVIVPVTIHVTVNSGSAVARCVDKKATFQFLKAGGVRTLPWTTQRSVAQKWWNNNSVVYCRTRFAGHAGAGIVMARKEWGVPLAKAALYTRFTVGQHEVRVLCSGYNKVPDVVLYKRRVTNPEALSNLGIEKPNYWIRTHDNGWVFCEEREGEEYLSEKAKYYAEEALMALALDFGAVDMQVSVNEDGEFNYRVIEVNSAPAIERTDSAEWITKVINCTKETWA